MNWIAIIPLIIDVLREATQFVSAMEDCDQKSEAKKELRGVLDSYAVHTDLPRLRGDLKSFSESNGGARR